uniref:Macrophage-expressed gene 1 protein n=1 Tax=Panagrolaimus sp. ES5 TaxID=591445 RepID=A0AC34F806_9BILA
MKLLSLIVFIIIFDKASTKTKEKPIAVLNDIDTCIRAIQSNIKGKNTTKTLSGLVGIGWDDPTNSYTLPILKTTFKKCLTDNNNEYLIPDNVFIIQIQDADIERSATQIDSFKSMMESSSNKIGVAGSATFKGVKVGGSFSSENQQSKESFEKQTSIMLLNKIHYSAFELIVDENDGFDQYFVERIEDIAYAVDGNKMLWGKFLAETFISDFGTHMVNKATAGAEIAQETYISKSETYKGEKTIDAYKAEVTLGFKEIAKISIGYETRNEASETHTTSKVTTSKILKTRGGPNIQRISKEEKDESMLHVENLVGLKQSGKYLYEIIPALKLPKFSDYVKYAVQKLIQNATEDYYRYNYRPGCMDINSENFNRIANADDDSCMDPNLLFAFSGVFQTCTPISSKNVTEEYYYSGIRCESLEIPNPMTGNFSCFDNIQAKKVYSFAKIYNDRKTEVEKERCGIFSFIFGCTTEIVEIAVIDEIRLEVFWCPISKNLTKERKQEKDYQKNYLDIIMVHESLHAINTKPNLLETYFPYYFDELQLINESEICTKDIHDMFNEKNPKGDYYQVKWIVDYYDSMARGFSQSDNVTFYYPRKYAILWDESTWDRTDHRYDFIANNGKPQLLNIRADQLEMLKHYPAALKALLPILDIPFNIRYSRTMYDKIASNPAILEAILFNKTTIYEKEPEQIMLFGGAFKDGTLNPFTGTYECPPYFQPMTILYDFILCLATDNKRDWPLRLGGFFNCDSDLKLCPLGYSEYLGNVHDECEYYYCIRFHQRNVDIPIVINKPPYTDYRKANAEAIPTD